MEDFEKDDCIGFIGLGLMGKHMVINLLKKNCNLVCYDIINTKTEFLQDSSVTVATNISEVVSRSNVILLSLPNSHAVESVIDTIIKSNYHKRDRTVINTSTVNSSLAKKMYKKCIEAGITYYDAPVSGGVKGAKNGQLTFMVGGDEKRLKHIEPILKCMGKKVFYVGPCGTGSTIKLINQLLFFSGVLSVCEVIYYAENADVNHEKLLEVITESSGNSYAIQTRLKEYIDQDNYYTGSNVGLAIKDVELIIEEARELNIKLPILEMVEERLEKAKNLGMTDKDISKIADVYEDLVI